MMGMNLQQVFAWIESREPRARLVGDGVTPLARVHTDSRTLQAGDLGKAIAEGAVDNAQLRDVNEAIRGHEIEKVGQKLRGYMTDMKRIAVAG